MIQHQYAYGAIICYLYTSLLWGYLAAFNYKWRKKRFAGCVGLCIIFIVAALRNFEFFVWQNNTVTVDLMYSSFVQAAGFAVSSWATWRDRG